MCNYVFNIDKSVMLILLHFVTVFLCNYKERDFVKSKTFTQI